jgi:hypothetical protein
LPWLNAAAGNGKPAAGPVTERSGGIGRYGCGGVNAIASQRSL